MSSFVGTVYDLAVFYVPLFVVIGLFFSFRSIQKSESKWAGAALLGAGIFFVVLIVIFLAFAYSYG